MHDDPVGPLPTLLCAVGLCLWVLLGWSSRAQAASVTLTWDCTGGCATADRFRMYKSGGSGCTATWVALTPDILVPIQTFAETGLTPGMYCYRVSAIDALGQESGPSNTVSFLVSAPPASPSNLRATVSP